jgi:hypothetical protein
MPHVSSDPLGSQDPAWPTTFTIGRIVQNFENIDQTAPVFPML